MPEFTFNWAEVCDNPTELYRMEKSPSILAVKVASFEGKWGYGLTVWSGQRYMGMGVRKADCKYDTWQAAGIAAVEDIEQHKFDSAFVRKCLAEIRAKCQQEALLEV